MNTPNRPELLSNIERLCKRLLSGSPIRGKPPQTIIAAYPCEYFYQPLRAAVPSRTTATRSTTSESWWF